MNDQNLRPPTTSEARERGRLGGLASGESRRERKQLREHLEIALAMDTDFDGETMSNAEAITAALVRRAKGGDVRAYTTIRDGVGEKPAERIIAEEPIPEEAYEHVRKMMEGD